MPPGMPLSSSMTRAAAQPGAARSARRRPPGGTAPAAATVAKCAAINSATRCARPTAGPGATEVTSGRTGRPVGTVSTPTSAIRATNRLKRAIPKRGYRRRARLASASR